MVDGGGDADALCPLPIYTASTLHLHHLLHFCSEALDGGEFFARVTFRIIHEHVTPRRAITAVAKQSSPFIQRKVKQAFAKFDEATDPQSPLSKEDYVDDLALTSMARLWDVGKTEPIKVGKASPTEGK